MADPAIAQLEVTVRFSVGSTQKTLEELESVQPGHIFETGAAIDQPVTIEVNGAVLGRGELVHIGDKLGVRVKEYGDHGRL